MSGRRDYKQRRRAELFGDQNGICFWCDEPMKLLMRYPIDGKLPPDACTIDHLRDRDNLRRREQPKAGEQRLVAACFACNHESDVARQRVENRLRRQEMRA
jgi:hypothetical protein